MAVALWISKSICTCAFLDSHCFVITQIFSKQNNFTHIHTHKKTGELCEVATHLTQYEAAGSVERINSPVFHYCQKCARRQKAEVSKRRYQNVRVGPCMCLHKYRSLKCFPWNLYIHTYRYLSCWQYIKWQLVYFATTLYWIIYNGYDAFIINYCADLSFQNTSILGKIFPGTLFL